MRRILLLLLALLTVTPPALAEGGVGGALESLGLSLGLSKEPAFLEPDQAFIFSADVADADTLVARWQITDGYYLYRDKFSFTILDNAAVTLGEPALPPGKLKHDPSFGEMEVYFHRAEIRLPVSRKDGAGGPLTLEVRYQGCAEAGLCYPPITRTISLTLPPADAAAPRTAIVSAAPPPAPLPEQDRIAASLASGQTLLTIGTFFGFGLLLAFTPCVFPMVPILSGLIVGQGAQLTPRKAFVLSLVYVLAMALTYTIAGVLAGLFGENLQAWFQNPWILGAFSAVFVLLALSMFGFFELQLPSSLQSKLAEVSNRQSGGTLVGVGIMGFLSALIVGPCVAPPLAGALIYIGQSGDAVLGGLALFALSLGMGAPLLVIGTSAGKLLPRAGGWMNAVKAVFGVLLLAIAIWLLQRVLPDAISMALWGVLLVVSGIYLGALEPLNREATGWSKLWKGSGLVLLIYGGLLLIGAASGGKDPLQPLQALASPAAPAGTAQAATAHGPAFKTIKTTADLERELAAAQKPVLLDFYADWCISCVEMEKYTFTDPAVQQAMNSFTLLRADVTANDSEDKALLKRFQIIGPPSIMFFDQGGQEQRNRRVVGFMKAAEFQAHLQAVAAPAQP